jgi:hypothetical protein
MVIARPEVSHEFRSKELFGSRRGLKTDGKDACVGPTIVSNSRAALAEAGRRSSAGRKLGSNADGQSSSWLSPSLRVGGINASPASPTFYNRTGEPCIVEVRVVQGDSGPLIAAGAYGAHRRAQSPTPRRSNQSDQSQSARRTTPPRPPRGGEL